MRPLSLGRRGRRRWLAGAAAAAVGLLTGLPALAAAPVVEIVAYAHPPVQQALKPLRARLASQGRKLSVVEIDLDTPAGAQRLNAAGVTGHVPLVLLIDGQFRHRRADGSAVELIGFPAPAGKPPGTTAWTLADVEALLAARLR